ncbi:class I SAM-dependent methyltransferase [Streptomyces sp. NPDC051561]|uniref:class I SAM-dependent methyltransferase n=1 Tax=Streptomyces sp. NPDC051561 TaxID=3365658 RepID=UPI0037A106C6
MNETDVVGIYERADIYEAIYRGRGKDYQGEAKAALAHVRSRTPQARSLLDVACGTGSHLKYFAEEFPRVEGVDLTEEMLVLARAHVPGVPLHKGDLRDFDLGATFDAVTCMFGSIGYLADTGELDRALVRLAHHLNPGATLVIEPWWSPDTFTPGHVGADLVEVDGRTISRVSHTTLHPDRSASRMEVNYAVAEGETGLRTFTDLHVMTLFSREEYAAAFAGAGLTMEFAAWDQSGPGLLVATRPAGTAGSARGDR